MYYYPLPTSVHVNADFFIIYPLLSIIIYALLLYNYVT